MADALSSLSAHALSQRLHALAGEERALHVDFLRHLDELDRRRSFLELGYPSLWEYCLRALHLREGAAARRIGAMRVLRRFPRVEDALRDGRLCLSTMILLGPVLTAETLDDLVGRAAFKTKAEVDALVASVKPRNAPADGIRRLPADAPAPLTTSEAPPRSAMVPESQLPAERAGAPQPVPIALHRDDARERPLPASGDPARQPRPPEVRAVSGDQWSLRVTLDSEARADLETLTMLLSHKIPRSDVAAVLKEALRCAIEKHGKRKGATRPPPKRTAMPCAGAVPPVAAPADTLAARHLLGVTRPPSRARSRTHLSQNALRYLSPVPLPPLPSETSWTTKTASPRSRSSSPRPTGPPRRRGPRGLSRKRPWRRCWND